MKVKFLLVAFLVGGVAAAKDHHFYEKGTLTEMNGVNCGWDQRGAMSVPGVLLGADDQHTKTKQMVCQEYTLQSDHITYRIRPKDDKHPVLLPVGETAEFRIAKDRMWLRVPEGNGKERQYLVVSMVPHSPAGSSKTSEGARAADR